LPTIDVNKQDFISLMGGDISSSVLERLLPVAKAELKKEDEDTYTIELTDTNRPDLWTVEGLARSLRLHQGTTYHYDFYRETATEEILVSKEMLKIRPYVAGFKASGAHVTEALLLSLIQTQEKLCENYGHGRETVAIGVYRGENIEFPVFYRPGDPEKDSFIPLGMGQAITLREILEKHPKGKDYRHIIEPFSQYPILEDSIGEVLSMPPIINSAGLGNVQIGDVELFIELTGTAFVHLHLCASIMATALADRGWVIRPVTTVYPYAMEEIGGVPRVIAPRDMGRTMKLNESRIRSCLGLSLSDEETRNLLSRAGHVLLSSSKEKGTGLEWVIKTPPYRDDCMHQVDLIEDVAIQRGYDSFEPLMPEEFTVGRIDEEERLADAVRQILVGAGYQECMSAILSSRETLTYRMNRVDPPLVEIDNVMSSPYAILRDSLLPSVLAVEAASAKAIYPHRIFELGEVAFLDPLQADGIATCTSLGCLGAHAEASLSEMQSLLDVLSHFLRRAFELRVSNHPSFLQGRFAEIAFHDVIVGMLGEVHPEVLFRWGIGMPCACLEVKLTPLI